MRKCMPTCVLIAALAAVWGRVGWGQVWGAPAVETIGAQGDLNQLVIEGLPPREAGELRQALVHSIFVQRYAAPSVPVPLFAGKVTGAVRRSLVAAGYERAQVEGVLEKGAYRLKIDAGTRYTAGDARVDVPAGLDGAALVRVLTTGTEVGRVQVEYIGGDVHVGPMPPFTPTGMPQQGKPAVWQAGEAANFSKEYRDWLEMCFRQGLLEQGYADGQVTIRLERDEAKKTANLRMAVTDLAPRLKLRRLEVTGAAKTTPGAVKTFLGLKEGQAIDVPTALLAYEKLYASGRYGKQDVIVHLAAGGDASQADMEVKVEEILDPPPLDQPLSEVEEAALRLRDRIMHFKESEEDLVFSMEENDGEMHFMVSSSGGLGARVMFRQSNVEAELAVDARHVAARGGETQHYLAEMAQYPARAMFWILVGPRSFSMYSGFVSTVTRQPAEFRLEIMPAAFVDLARDPRNGATVKDGILTAKVFGMLVTSDAKTGEIKEIASPPEVQGKMHFTMKKGALAERLEAFHTAQDPNAFDAQRPLVSTLRFALAGIMRLPLWNPQATAKERAAMAEAMGQLLTPEVLAPLDDITASLGKDNPFAVGHSMQELQMLAMNPRNMVVTMLASAVDNPYPYGTWAWTLYREMVLPSDVEAKQAEIARLWMDPDLGPVGCALAAKVFAADRVTAAKFAQLGLSRLNPEGLQKDLAVLVRSEGNAGKMARALLTELRALPRDRVETLAQALPPEWGTALRGLHEALQATQGRQVEDALPIVARNWFGVVRPNLEQRLQDDVPSVPELPDLNIAPPPG